MKVIKPIKPAELKGYNEIPNIDKDEALGYALPKCIDENNKIETYCILEVVED